MEPVLALTLMKLKDSMTASTTVSKTKICV